ncbi:MAG: 50S ribosomal protein L15 [Planctomycetota bacterium]
MNITEITKQAGADRRRRRVGRGRGSGHGKTCGRGHKGAGQRSGASRFNMREGGQMPTFRRLPKRGFSNALFKVRYSVVNVEALEGRFEAGAHITAQALVEAGLIRNTRMPVKVLGNGGLSKKLTVDAAKFSKSAQEKIESAGGTVNLV